MKATAYETPLMEDNKDGGGQEDRAKRRNNGIQNNLDLRLGISYNSAGVEDDDTVMVSNISGAKMLENNIALHRNSMVNDQQRWFPEAAGGYIDPWSLAARQQKAILEQAHQNLICSSPSSSIIMQRVSQPAPSSSPVVGWPPIRTFRKNIITPQPPKSPPTNAEKESNEMEQRKRKESPELKMVDSDDTMYVKVNMEGFAVGRKINLKAHDSYESLSRTLQKMFHNFLCANFLKIENKDEIGHNAEDDYILLYQDNEGDCLLVGDVPWEMFITSVKRLFLAHDPKASKQADEKMME